MASTGIGTETGADHRRTGHSKRNWPGQLPRGIACCRSALAAIVLVGWQLAVTLGHIPPVILPSPVSITKYIIDRYDILLMHAIPTTLWNPPRPLCWRLPCSA